MSISDRIAKLQRMAEHPRSNPHEAQLAREEMERLKKAHPESGDNSWLHVGSSKDFDEFEKRYADMINRERAGSMDDLVGQAFRHVANRVHAANRTKLFAASLKVGDQAQTAFDISGLVYNGPPLESKTMTVARLTATQIIFDDGSRFRRTGQFPGYKVGEDGRAGYRTYVIPVLPHV
jgi:hypothetical protein